MSKVEGFTPEDEENSKRGARAKVRTAFTRIKVGFFWFLFIGLCVLITACAIGYLFLVWIWLSSLIWGTSLHDPAALKDVIVNVLWVLLVIFATLFLEGVFRDRAD